MKMIEANDERINQFRSKLRAQKRAQRETARTGRHHQILLTHTWRNLEERLCWTVVLAMHWRNGHLVTK